MPKVSPRAVTQRRRSAGLRLYYAACAGLVALTSGVAIFATVAPASAATLTQSVDPQLAVFLVPLALLMVTIIVEVLRTTAPAAAPQMQVSGRRLRSWGAQRREG